MARPEASSQLLLALLLLSVLGILAGGLRGEPSRRVLLPLGERGPRFRRADAFLNKLRDDVAAAGDADDDGGDGEGGPPVAASLAPDGSVVLRVGAGLPHPLSADAISRALDAAKGEIARLLAGKPGNVVVRTETNFASQMELGTPTLETVTEECLVWVNGTGMESAEYVAQDGAEGVEPEDGSGFCAVYAALRGEDEEDGLLYIGDFEDGASMEYAPLPVADPPLSIKPDLPFGSPSWLEHFRAKIREMFFHAFGAYLQHAYPKDELRPLSCAGEDNFGGTQATLIDSLDTLAVLGEWDLLRSCLSLARSASFDGDADVSVFETNIRILGGLLSAHLAAQRGVPGYSGHLLSQAHDLGRRLLRAFASSSTGMPYGTVNLRTGIKRGETESTCTACVGTYALEFSWLSLLTGDASFERASRRAVRALARSATPLGLYGGHVNITSGEWIHAEASVGADSDSFYEYLFKAHFAFADEAEYGPIAAAALEGIRTHLKKGVWHFDVHASNGQTVFPWHHSLAAFFPGLKVLRGDLLEAQDELWSSRMIMDRCGGFLPEQFDLRSASPVAGRSHYPLRPEFAESAWALHRATRDPWLLDWAARFAADLDTRTRVGCGFAGLADVGTGELADRMDSFLLSETLKYLYLVFDAGNEYNGPPNGRDWVFTTEAHPLPVTDRRGWRGGRWVGVDRRRRKRRAGPESPPPPPAPPFSDPGTRTFESPAMVSAIHAESVGAYRERSRAAWEAGVCLYDEWVEATHGRIWGRTVGGMRIRG